MSLNKRTSELYRSKRSEIHDEKEQINRSINLELLIKQKAIQLRSVTKDKKAISQADEAIANLDVKLRNLKLQLDNLNCSFLAYQKLTSDLPMIPVSMKNTTYIDLKKIVEDSLKSRYSTDPKHFADFIEEFHNLRKAVVEPERSELGLEKHKKYYSYLNAVERRFFPVDAKRKDIHFDWSDSFLGISYKQRSTAFEKGCVLFNIGCIYSQIATNFDRSTPDGLQNSNKFYTKAAQIFIMVRNNFSNAPSNDMSKPVLTLLSSIMMLQAQECLFLEFALNPKQENENFQRLATYIGEAISLGSRYEYCPHINYSKEYEIVPYSWNGMCSIKSAYFKAQAYYRLAAALLGLSMYGIEFNADGTIEDTPKLLDYDKQVESELKLWMDEISHVVRFTVPLDPEDAIGARKKKTFHSLSRKSGQDALASTKRSHSSLSTKSWKHRSDSVKSTNSEMNNRQSQEIKYPTNRFDACQVGKACLVESIRYMEEVSRIIRINDSLKNQTEFCELVEKILSNWKVQHDRLHHNQKALQMRYAPDYPLDDQKSMNGDTGGTTKLSTKLRKSVSNLSIKSVDNKKGKNSMGSTSNLARDIHVAPRLLPTGSKDIQEPPELSFTDEIEIIEDPFYCLGPVDFFNAQTEWSPLKTFKITKKTEAGFGFSIKGDCPIRIINCDPNTPAYQAGLQPKDVLVAVNGINVLWMLHREAVELVHRGYQKENGEFDCNTVEMVVVSPKY